MKLDPEVKDNLSRNFKYSLAVVVYSIFPGRISASTSAGDFSFSSFITLIQKACAGSTSKRFVASQKTPSRTLNEINRDTNNDLKGLRPTRFNIGLVTAPDNSHSFRQHLQLHVGLSQHNRLYMSLVGG